MDSGFNMLGQFQGDSSLGLGSFQGNSYPSLEFSSLEDRSLSNPSEKTAEAQPTQIPKIQPTHWYAGWRKKSKEEKADITKTVHNYLETERNKPAENQRL